MYRTSTPQALALKSELEHRGIIVQAEYWDGHKSIDLVIPRAKLNIEVDGRQHYEDPFQIMADLGRMHYSKMKEGFDTLHIPNIFIDSKDNLNKVANALSGVAILRAGQLGHRFNFPK